MKFLRLSFFFLSLCVEFGVQYIFPNNNIFRNPRLLPLFIAINSEKPQSSATSPQASSSSPSSSSSPNDRYIHPQVFKMFQRANHLAKNGDNITARRLLARCIELSPMDSHSWLALARLEAKWGNIDRARELFTESVQHFPTNVHILQAWGHMEQKFGNDTFARACLEQALEIEPLNAYVCHTLSSIEIRHENIDRARRILDPVFRRRPTSAIAICYADMERREGNIDKANEILLQALKTCKYDKCDILLSLAWLEEDALGNPEEAYNLIDMALKQQPSNIKIYIAKANMELRLNKFAKARQTLQHALTLQSDDGKHYTMLGSLELELGNYREAQRVLLAGVALFPGDFFLLQRLGALESKHGSAKRARDIFNRAIMIQPHAPTFVAWAILEESLGNLAITPKIAKSKLIEQNTQSLPLQEVTDFFNGSDNDARNSSQSALDRDLNPEFKDPVAALEFADSQFKKARELFSLGAIVDSRHGPLYHAYGSMEMRHGNASGARQIFQRAIESNCSDLPTIYHGLAILEVKDGHTDLAAQTFKKGIEAGLRKTEVDPSLRYLFHSLGMLELDGHRVAEAERVFQSGIKLFPTHSHLLLGLALAETKLGRAELARRHFKEAVDADVYHAHAWQCWALFEKQSGNIELATILFKQGLKKNPTHAPLWQAFALMEVHQGNADAARSLFAESIKRCPSHAHTYQAWACLEMKLGNLAQAKELTWQGLRRSPTHAALWTVTGLVEAKLGDVAKARETLKSGIARFPNHGALYKVLGEIESREGEFLEARHWFNLGIEKDPRYTPLYHEAALFEAKLGNLEGLASLHRLAKAEFKEQTSSSQGIEQADVIEKIRHLEDSTTAGQREASLRSDRGSSYMEYDVLSSLTDDEFDEYSRLGEASSTFAISTQDEY